MTNWTNKNVLVIGAARQGQALARYLTKHGAHVTLNDKRMPMQMQAAQSALQGVDVKWALGSHSLSLLKETHLLCISGGVPLDLPIIREAQRRNIPLSNDTQIFLEAAPCQTIGITGSAGKTTTTTLVGRMAEIAFANSENRAWTGGNIGDPLLNYVDEMQSEDIAILEISSFQLEQMRRSTDIAVVLNITPNHLDRHGTMAAYTAAKVRILQLQKSGDIAILGRDDEGAWAQRKLVAGKLLSFGSKPLAANESGVYLLDNFVYMRDERAEIPLLDMDVSLLRGHHNVLNILAACTIAYAAGFSADAIQGALDGFNGVPHRLEFVRELQGVRWYNDSIATAPERAMAAIRSFNEPIVLLLGGRDKNLPWDTLAELIRQRVDHVVLFGEASQKIGAVLGSNRHGQRPHTISYCFGLKDAVAAAAKVAENGDVVLLSPGGTSFDEFRDFAERGESFRKWVLELS
ncbi:MAG: UDP-N-acetylmuramoyl-L-alanine--D-glutamate ligase [Anaerolineales bacterium]|nr:UDP-N-acetylmuramoyl-L-alanine--D-glutamate ligase [Anaerolineales bacterium]